ncbi:DUF262 domain-containing protein [Amycolatopsis keratiniphila]|uniref:DUF262 domain-containing protein n=1 Tax=Amycolatopsis keratiniphila subsp. keratiniphila TaxID=227715 RepID=A0A1W2LJT4_9PSEU|nr:DUF262 domain-containing protein [Amycolatopsis keratiniphila]OLZ49667.1 hypothetical protein BS330_30495 [Amycolatopsis keratiniphila subsp. nogabecina]ONF63094.1 hypothetical protein AVR91_0235085 [Amycolatopsis keratiniphila subsp. keratiniphila]SDU22654.1 Protein of unknown function [Amycolatopsis keratiniphila]
MQANTLTPQKLFEPQVRYVIPVFQRPYVWEIEKQWEPLWADVRAVAEELLEAQDLAHHPEVPAHFLGAVVLDQQPNPAGYIQVRHVIDGQQRLITLQLLLNAVRQVAEKYGRSRDAALLKALVRNPEHIIEEDDELLKVWPILADRAPFQDAMDDDPANDSGEHRVSQAIVFLRERIRSWALESGEDEASDRLRSLTTTLARHLKLVVIDLEPGDNAQAIFEALNDRGSPLLAADLVKNAVFQAAERQHLDTEQLDRDYWEAVSGDFWRKELRQGRLNRPRIDVFLNYWLTMRRAHLVPSDRIFTDFRDHVLTPAEDVRTVLAELKSDAQCYRQLDSLAPYSTPGTFHYRVIEVMDIAATMPLLLWLLRPASSVPPAARDQALKAVESWLVRRMLCRTTLADTNSVVVELIKHLGLQEPHEIGTATERFLAEQTGDSRRWPLDVEVIDSLRKIRFYSVMIPRRRGRMVLEALEDSYRSPKSEDAHCPRGSLTIEHIMPVSWEKNWSTGLADDADSRLRRDHRVQRLGNLTLLTSRLNPVLSNSGWSGNEHHQGKREGIAEHSVLMLNKHLLADQARWTEEDIEERSHLLASQIAEKIWTRPA